MEYNIDNMVEKIDTSKPLLGKRYQILESLGTGGMAIVYRANDLMLDRQVAIKLLRQRYSRDSSFREQFHQEAKAAGNLTHQNIVTVYDFGLDDQHLYIVMEYVPGSDLKSMMIKKGIFTVNESLHLITQACFGIGYAHRAGIVHCDVKPHNMLVTPRQHLKVTDFGIARVLATIHSDEQYDIVWGSPQYFAPEQASGAPPSPASDVYSIGVILYEMLTGRLPFISDDPQKLVQMHREMQPPTLREYNQNIPVSVERIILKVLSKNPNARFSSADQLGRVLLTIENRLDSSEQISLISSKSKPVSTPSTPPRSLNAITPAISKLPTATAVSTTQQPFSNSSLRNTPNVKSKPSIVTPKKSNHNDFSLFSMEDSLFNIDWITLGLGILAVFFISGLVPFWLYIWLALKETIP